MNAGQRGRWGEEQAAEHYRQQGYTLLAQNYASRFGEVDLVLAKDEVLVFAEVKTRSAGAIATPGAWVDRRKQQKLVKTAALYMQETGDGEAMVRFDVVEVTWYPDGKTEIQCIENAFFS